MSGGSEGRVWVGMGWLDIYSVTCLGEVGCVPGMCVSVWLLLRATSAPYREGRSPWGRGTSMPGYCAVGDGTNPRLPLRTRRKGRRGRHAWLGQLALRYGAYSLRLAGLSWPKGLASGCCDLGVHVAAPSLLSGLACWSQNRDEPSWADGHLEALS